MFEVVINNRNRLATTKKLVEDLFKLDHEIRITILDNGSTYQPLLEWYEALPFARVAFGKYTPSINIIRLPNLGHLALWASRYINEIDSEWFFYTDSDLQLNGYMPQNYQTIMFNLAEKTGYDKISLALDIENIPDHYPFKEQVIKNEKVWWEKHIGPNMYEADTDTTFSLIRKGEHIYKSIRLAGAFTAKHVPWHLDYNNLSEEEKYYLEHSDPFFNTQYTKQHQNLCQIKYHA